MRRKSEMAKKILLSVSERKGIVGGSSIGAFLGLSKYKSVYEAYEDFMGISSADDITPEKAEIFEMGHQLEEFIASQTERLFNVKLRKTSYAFVHPKYDWLICHPDRIVAGKIDGKRIGVEIKSSSTYDNARWGEADSDQAPMDYLCQCHDYIMCGVCDEVWLIRFCNNRITRYIITKDEELEETIIVKLVEVIEKIKGGWIPPIEDPKKASNVYDRPTDGDILADEEIKSTVDEWNSLKAQAKELDQKADMKKALIISYMKDKKFLVNDIGEVLAKYISVETTKLDTKKLKADCPDLYEKYSSKSSYMKLT